MFKIIEHTADVGVEIAEGTVEELFISAAQSVFSIMIESKSNLIPAITVPINIQLDHKNEQVHSYDLLLIKWLQELLYVFETRHIVFSHFYIDDISELSIEGCAKGLKFDKARHKFKTEIKAVTYHNLQVVYQDDKWCARVIFDI